MPATRSRHRRACRRTRVRCTHHAQMSTRRSTGASSPPPNTNATAEGGAGTEPRPVPAGAAGLARRPSSKPGCKTASSNADASLTAPLAAAATSCSTATSNSRAAMTARRTRSTGVRAPPRATGVLPFAMSHGCVGPVCVRHQPVWLAGGAAREGGAEGRGDAAGTTHDLAPIASQAPSQPPGEFLHYPLARLRRPHSFRATPGARRGRCRHVQGQACLSLSPSTPNIISQPSSDPARHPCPTGHAAQAQLP